MNRPDSPRPAPARNPPHGEPPATRACSRGSPPAQRHGAHRRMQRALRSRQRRRRRRLGPLPFPDGHECAAKTPHFGTRRPGPAQPAQPRSCGSSDAPSRRMGRAEADRRRVRAARLGCAAACGARGGVQVRADGKGAKRKGHGTT